MSNQVRNQAESWLSSEYDEETRKEVQRLLEEDSEELVNSFYRSLEFGTGGLRGIVGAGTNRVNRYTIGAANQGLANYLKKQFPGRQAKVAIAYDSRNSSVEFSTISSEILSANGIKVFLFDSIRPTPELSFTIRELNCDAGIVITASHNPKEYNGYKVYWSDGGQLVSPHDKNIIAEVNKISSVSEINFSKDPTLVDSIGEELDQEYIKRVRSLSLSPEIVKSAEDFQIVYTPLHGSGMSVVPQCLSAFGFDRVHVVAEQNTADGNFPTVPSPNPEDPKALSMALELAKSKNADLVLATDPDADRVGIAARNETGELEILNGNQIASILVYYVLKNQKSPFSGNEYVGKTIVTTDLLADIAGSFSLDCHEVLTGFKFIAADILANEGKKKFLVGGEESFGYLVGDFVRDKDAVISCCMIAEAAVWAKSKGKTLSELLKEIYLENSFYLEKLVSLTKPGKSGEEEIAAIIKNLRDNPPQKILDADIVARLDYQTSECIENGKTRKINLPKSNILQFRTSQGDLITVRPSGTEPKIKFYFSVKTKLDSLGAYDATKVQLEDRLEALSNLFVTAS